MVPFRYTNESDSGSAAALSIERDGHVAHMFTSTAWKASTDSLSLTNCSSLMQPKDRTKLARGDGGTKRLV